MQIAQFKSPLLVRDAVNTAALRNGPAAQTLRVYNTTDAGLTNYERGIFSWASNALTIGTQAGGTGVNRQLRVSTDGGTNYWAFAAGTSPHFLAASHNAYDIGGSVSSTAPRNVYAGTSVQSAGTIHAFAATAIPAGGAAGSGLKVSSATNFGVFFGSGAPSLAAAKGSLYLRSDGSGVADRMYVNTDGSTAWTAVATAG